MSNNNPTPCLSANFEKDFAALPINPVDDESFELYN
jgi:hypothetical protein